MLILDQGTSHIIMNTGNCQAATVTNRFLWGLSVMVLPKSSSIITGFLLRCRVTMWVLIWVGVVDNATS